MSFVRRKTIALLCCICTVSARKMGRRNKRYYNGLKGAAKQKELGIVSSGTTGLTLRDEIAPKDHSRPPSTPKRLRI
jgi:hypothetical protein